MALEKRASDEGVNKEVYLAIADEEEDNRLVGLASELHDKRLIKEYMVGSIDNVYERTLECAKMFGVDRSKAKCFHREFGDNLHFSWVTTPSYPGVDFINVVAPGVTKGEALKALASHLGIALDEVIAVGDGNNDISLLSSAGLGVAMGNATDRAKEVADYVTLDVERGGVAAAIRKFLL